MVNKEENFTITKTTKGSLPRLPFEDIKNAVLGKGYFLSLNIVGDKLSKDLNKKYRGKNYVPNVLSFPYSKSDGEIYLNPNKARKEAHLYENNFKEHLAFLFIHGLLHLKGMDHGSRMESKEREVCRKFGFRK